VLFYLFTLFFTLQLFIESNIQYVDFEIIAYFILFLLLLLDCVIFN